MRTSRHRRRPRRIGSVERWLHSSLKALCGLTEIEADRIAHTAFLGLTNNQTFCAVGDCAGRCVYFALKVEDLMEWHLYGLCEIHAERMDDSELAGSVKFRAQDHGDVVMVVGLNAEKENP